MAEILKNWICALCTVHRAPSVVQCIVRLHIHEWYDLSAARRLREKIHEFLMTKNICWCRWCPNDNRFITCRCSAFTHSMRLIEKHIKNDRINEMMKLRVVFFFFSGQINGIYSYIFIVRWMWQKNISHLMLPMVVVMWIGLFWIGYTCQAKDFNKIEAFDESVRAFGRQSSSARIQFGECVDGPNSSKNCRFHFIRLLMSHFKCCNQMEMIRSYDRWK